MNNDINQILLFVASLIASIFLSALDPIVQRNITPVLYLSLVLIVIFRNKLSKISNEILYAFILFIVTYLFLQYLQSSSNSGRSALNHPITQAPPQSSSSAGTKAYFENEIRNSVPVVVFQASCFNSGLSNAQLSELCSVIRCKDNDRLMGNDSVSQSVCVASFAIDQYEVSGILYADGVFEIDSIPKYNVSWKEALGFCENRGGRLPSEQEWELAARGPNSTILIQLESNARSQELRPISETTSDRSWAGVYGLSTNVREWVLTYDQTPDERRVVKGAGFRTSNPLDFRLSLRALELFDSRELDIGFRCAYDP